MTKLEAMLKYVSEHNDFYKRRIKEYGITNPLDITQWPILTRKELQENRYNMFSDGYKSKYFNQQLRRQSSSGSSGIPVNVYWDYKDYWRSNISIWRLRAKYHGITPASRKVLFSLPNTDNDFIKKPVFVLNQNENILNINRACIQDESILIEVIKIIESFAPDWIYIQPSILQRLSGAYKRNNIKPPKSLKYIESFGEILSPKMKDSALTLFNIPLVNMYGSEENNSIAYEIDNEMSVITDNVNVEVSVNGNIFQDGEGEAIISNLNNYAMPLIRYSQGDIIIKRCGQRNKTESIQIIKGRNGRIIAVNNCELTPFLLNEVIAEVQNQFSDPIEAYIFKFNKSNNILTLCLALYNTRACWENVIHDAIVNAFHLKISETAHIDFVVKKEDAKDITQMTMTKNSVLYIEE